MCVMTINDTKIHEAASQLQYSFSQSIGNLVLLSTNSEASSWGKDRAVQGLTSFILNPRSKIHQRREAAKGILEIGDVSNTTEAFIDILKKTPNMRKDMIRRKTNVIEALGILGGKNAIESLITELDNSEDSVRISAAEALGEIGDEKTVPMLVEALGTTKDKRFSSAILKSLGSIGGEVSRDMLIGYLKKGPENLRMHAIQSLGVIGDNIAVGPLVGLLDDRTMSVFVAEALGEIGTPEVVDPLLSMLKEDRAQSASMVITSLGKTGNEQAVEPLVELLRDENQKAKHGYIRQVLPNFGAKALRPLVQLYKMGRPGIEPLLENLPPEKVGAEFERLLFFEDAIQWYTKNGLVEKAAEARKKQVEMGAAKVSQKVVQGDEITSIQDSVLHKSNVGGSNLMTELKELVEMKRQGLLTEEEFTAFKQKLLKR